MTISTPPHRGIVSAFDELKGIGQVKLMPTEQEFVFRNSGLKESVEEGDQVEFRVSPGKFGGLLAYDVSKVKDVVEQSA